jgi:hypothetical protein
MDNKRKSTQTHELLPSTFNIEFNAELGHNIRAPLDQTATNLILAASDMQARFHIQKS